MIPKVALMERKGSLGKQRGGKVCRLGEEQMPRHSSLKVSTGHRG